MHIFNNTRHHSGDIQMNSANKLPALMELILSWEKQHEEIYTRQQKMLFKKKGEGRGKEAYGCGRLKFKNRQQG